MQIKYLIYASFLVFAGCDSNRYEHKAWEIANNTIKNNNEIVRFLDLYKQSGDNEKYEAACFLVSNIQGKHSLSEQITFDIDVVKADSLAQSLEESFMLRQKSPFLKEYSFKQFLEYILPYRITDEPLEYYWKSDCRRHFTFEKTSDIIEAAKQINAKVRLELSPKNYRDLPHSYSSLIHDGYGKCNDRSTLLVMALRSAGIPSAYEFVPYWGSTNNGHSFVSVILPDGEIYPLQNNDQATNDGYLSRKTPKIYRKMYGLQQQEEANTDIPELFENHDLLDVTALHDIQSCDVQIPVNKNEKPSTYYLSVFSPNGWMPVASSELANFQNVGTGVRIGNDITKEAVDLGVGIVYLPGKWSGGEVLPVGAPMVVSGNSVEVINADLRHRERVVLKRKYPLNTHIVDFAKLMIMGTFEGANKADFSDAEELYKITEIPESRMQKVKVTTTNNNKAYRYMRYRRPGGTFSIAEFCLYDYNGKRLPFRPVASEAIMEDSIMMNVFDGNPVTYYQVSGGVDMWIGMDLYKPVKVSSIGFAPRNDDNAIVAGEIYELFYWKNNWTSLGRKKAETDSLIYENAPRHALLWLRNLTKGREERPFTYENSKQIWW